jgi:hypothetical protein
VCDDDYNFAEMSLEHFTEMAVVYENLEGVCSFMALFVCTICELS